ncbi:lactose/L-arabinose transport system permease protein [Caldalkalibacillus uzonensis]|uniref:Lactose/L-arabinose transport system permease protein n=1 Tax=Caldalkalibacillus uzonensis TaxID=353224 RepID=A0ABU0CRZ1_9BACI|nr:sugar ABC transporter permease [Caldalkalibacillus uzonensis]MDQ0338641.1 lactose/L-arabinose transport system permease protein [Caldalkalibacillus uzonensis]
MVYVNKLNRKGKISMQDVSPYLFISPFFILFAVFMLYPLVYSLVLSFSEWRGGEINYVGLANYQQLFTDPLFWQSLYVTGLILVIQVPIMLLLATVLATVLNSNLLRFKGIFRLAFFMPVLIDLVTYSLVFSLMFNENYGMINQFLGLFGIEPIRWFADGFWAKVLIIVALTWRWTGYNTIIILSGLQNVPRDLYESANIDGAGPVTSFFKITVPMLKPVILFCAILSTIGTLQLFAEPYVLTGGGPRNETTTVILYLYDKAFGSFNFGLASAGAYVVTTIIAILSYLQIRMSKGGEI